MRQAEFLIIAFTMGLFSTRELLAQQPTPLALKVSISEDLRQRYGLKPQDLGTFEESISASVAETIADRYWYRFCWQLRATNKLTAAPDGEIRIDLDRNQRHDNWNLVLRLNRTNPPRVQHTFDPIEVLDSGELLRNRGPSKGELPGRLTEWLRQNFLCDDKVAVIHTKLKGIPIGEGMTAMGQPLPKPHGAVLIPWEKYSQFRWSTFRFECMAPSTEHWLSIASGGPVPAGTNEVIDVVHQTNPPAATPPRGTVYLVEFAEQGPDGGAGGELPIAP